jgi:sortase A
VKRLASTALLVAGLGVLGWVGWQYASGALARDRARAEWESLMAREAVVLANASLEAPLQQPLRTGMPVARLLAPRIDLDEVVLHGVGNRELNGGPGHLPGTVLPGAVGNSVISAHRDRHFRRLGELSPGDTVVTETRYQRAYWVIVDRKIVHAREPALFQTEDATLTLTTCWPLRLVGPAPDRLLLTARQISAPVSARS